MTITIIRQLYGIYQTPKHVQAHMKQVANVAVFIAKKIKKNGHKVDINFVRHLALVHDLMKAITFDASLRKKYPAKHDVIITSQILEKYHEKRLAAAVISQQFDAITSSSHPLNSLEEMIVYYADKRVAHTDVVSLNYRFEEGSRRYYLGKKHPKTSKKILTIQKKIFKLEKELSSVARDDISKIVPSDIT